jgi:hypothetical protein
LIYIDRLIQRNNFLLTELNVHRVVITAILLAAKFFDDAYYNNAYYSKVGGVLVSEMNGLEVDFLFRINFSLHVTPELFEKYKAELVAHSMQAAIAPQVSPQMPQIEEPSQAAAQLPAFAPSQALAAPIALQSHQSHHAPQQVTPSPSHMGPHNVGVVADSRPMYSAEQQQYAAAAAAELQLMSNGLIQQQQQILQRANSLPPFPSHSGRCSQNPEHPYSAPMVSMLPMGADEQYMLAVSRQLLPLQTTLVHHHHGAHEQVGFHAQAAGGPSYANNGIGSLVAGHY